MVWYGVVWCGIIGEKQGTITTTMGKRNETHPKSRRRDLCADKGIGWCECVCVVSLGWFTRGRRRRLNSTQTVDATYPPVLSLSGSLSFSLPLSAGQPYAQYCNVLTGKRTADWLR